MEHFTFTKDWTFHEVKFHTKTLFLTCSLSIKLWLTLSLQGNSFGQAWVVPPHSILNLIINHKFSQGYNQPFARHTHANMHTQHTHTQHTQKNVHMFKNMQTILPFLAINSNSTVRLLFSVKSMCTCLKSNNRCKVLVYNGRPYH